MYNELISFIRTLYPEDFIPLHRPYFNGNEKKYLNECIESTYVSSVGEFVNQFEKHMCEISGAKYAIATMNGTAALHLALIMADVAKGDEVLTQALTFVATANAVHYTGADPVFLDSAKNNLGMCPKSLETFLVEKTHMRDDGYSYNKLTGKRVKACVPMHVFGHPVEIDKIKSLCKKFNIILIEDAAEAIGSKYAGKPVGSFGDMAIFSFNGNKTVTAGGGGVLVTSDERLAVRAKHLSTTAKQNHKWDFYHTEIGYNYRLPNLNAALICAQLEQLDNFLKNKRQTADQYREFFTDKNLEFVDEPLHSKSSFWLNAVLCENINERNELLTQTNDNNIMTRPVWKLMCDLPAFEAYQKADLANARNFESRLVNLPSSVRI